MRFALSGGGTAGHVNPALALCSKLTESGDEVVFFGTPDGMEAHLARQAGLPFVGVEARGFNRSKPLTLITSSLLIARSAGNVARHFKENPPDAVVGFGGYATLPVGLAAAKRHIPLIVHEQNSVPGLANKELVKRGAHLALTFEMSRRYFDCPDERVHVVGNPVRASVLSGDRGRGRAKLAIPDDATLLLIMGGSLGARHLNEAIAACADDLMAIRDLYIVQSTGEKNYEEVLGLLGDRSPRWIVRPYIDDMGDMLAAADAAISRAGSTSLSEIAVCGLASILVPFPYATDDHQRKNAEDFEQVGASIVILDRELDDPSFKSRLVSFLGDRSRLERMGSAAATLAHPDAAGELAQLVREIASQRA